MKKMALLLALWLYFSAGFAAAGSLVKKPHDEIVSSNAAVFLLPSSLKEIQESAFENTAAETVILQDSVETIRDRAFANNNFLRTVCIPASVTFIDDHVFDGSLYVTVRGAENSYTAVWAQTHHIAYARAETASSLISKIGNLLRGSVLLPLCLQFASPQIQNWQRRKTKNRGRSMRPQDRPELNPIDYRFP